MNQNLSAADVERYYRKYGPMVLRRCRQLLGDEARALDAMQDVFTKVLVHRTKIKDRFPSSLLFRMATNTCLNIIRDNRSKLSLDDGETLEGISVFDDSEKRLEMRDLLGRIFRKEKPSTRLIAVMHFVDGMTLQEVAAEVGLSVSGVRKRIRELRYRTGIKKEILYEK